MPAKAYVKFMPYTKDFHTKAFGLGSIKGDGSVRFHNAVQLNCTHDQSQKRYTKTVAERNAVYLYGGKKALVQEFGDFKQNYGDLVLTPADTCWLSVYHSKITVNTNTKRILMILSWEKTSIALDVNDRRLIVDLIDYWNGRPGKSNMGLYKYLDLAGLDKIVRAIPN